MFNEDLLKFWQPFTFSQKVRNLCYFKTWTPALHSYSSSSMCLLSMKTLMERDVGFLLNRVWKSHLFCSLVRSWGARRVWTHYTQSLGLLWVCSLCYFPQRTGVIWGVGHWAGTQNSFHTTDAATSSCHQLLPPQGPDTDQRKAKGRRHCYFDWVSGPGWTNVTTKPKASLRKGLVAFCFILH